MKLEAVKLIYFSPTETTKKVVSAIAQGLQVSKIEHLNLTLLASKKKSVPQMGAELAIIGMPVYAGRLPVEAVERFKPIKGNNTPAVIVVVYGNRAYDDALLELRDLAIAAGFVPVAAGAFIGEHSFSNDDALIAHRRPDVDDLAQATSFGEAVRTKMESVASLDELAVLQVPGNVPYQEIRLPKNLAPMSDELMCTRCLSCFSACPTGAIALKGNLIVTDASRCTLCCACVKNCTTGARTLDDERIDKIRVMLTRKFSERKQPEQFFGL